MTNPWHPETAAPRPSLRIGGLIAQTFRLLFTRFTMLFPLAFFPALALALLDWGTSAPLPENYDPAVNGLPTPSYAELGVGIATSVLGFFITGFMCLAALDAVMGRRHTIAEYTRQTLRQILPIAVLGLLITLLGGLALALFIVPGLYVFARFLPWVEAVVFEDAGWSGLGRAQQLTEGYRWPLAGAVLLMGMIVFGLFLLITPLLVSAADSGFALTVIGAFASALYYSLGAIFTALIYARLREIKEGMTIEQIAATIG